jgi:iron(III) transport system ATP-binding protein
LLGGSGSWKRTLLRLVAGTERPDSGEIALGGQVLEAPARHVPPEKGQIGYVAGQGALSPHLSVARNLALGLRGAERCSRW